MLVPVRHSSGQFVEQCLGVFQVGGAKPSVNEP